MSVAEIKQAIVTLQGGISGVRRAFAQAPNSITAADCPAFVTFTGAGQNDWIALGAEMDRSSRIYAMRLHVMPQGAGIPGEGEALCEPFFEAVLAQFAKYPGLNGLPWVQNAVILDDSGIKVFDYGGTLFIGIEWRLAVTSYVERTYAPQE